MKTFNYWYAVFRDEGMDPVRSAMLAALKTVGKKK